MSIPKSLLPWRITSANLHTSQLRTGKVCNSTAQSIFEGDFRLPVERCFCLLVGKHRAIDVTLACGLVRRMQLPADGLAENRNEVIEARLRLRAEVVGRVRVLRRQRVHDAVRDNNKTTVMIQRALSARPRRTGSSAIYCAREPCTDRSVLPTRFSSYPLP